MTSNPKNLLQEYCQRQKIPLPSYTTTRCGGPNHQPKFISQVIFNKKSYEGEIADSKVKAEMEVALRACRDLGIISINPVPIKKLLGSKPLILIDLDNKGKAMSELTTYTEVADIVAFAGKLSSAARNDLIVPTGMNRIIVNSSQKDAVDVAIIIYLTQQIERGSYQSIYVLTGDHFGSTLTEILQQWYPEIKYTHVTSVSNFLTFLSN